MKPRARGHAARVAAPLALLLLAGCASVRPPGGPPYAGGPIQAHLQRDDEVGECARHLQAIDVKVEQRGVRDAMTPRVAGFPYLRVDRFSASLASRARGTPGAPATRAPAALDAWLERLSALDREARLVEFSNGQLHSAEWSALERCRPRLLAADFGGGDFGGARSGGQRRGAAERQRFDELVAAATVPDDYSESRRTLGLYPVTKFAILPGIREWQQRTRETFALPDNRLPTIGERVRYRPVAADDESTLAGVRAASLDHRTAPAPTVDALGVPVLTRAQGWELLYRHAPVLAVDTATLDDRLGRVGWRIEGETTLPTADVALPGVYARIAYATLGGRVHVQLVYTFWFPARRADGLFDPYAGRLDGVIWRVTLADSGASAAERFVPLAYDSIHACGCYHMFFPTERVRARPQPETFDEGLFVPRSVTAPRAGQRVVLHIASRTHYLQQVTIEPEAVAVGADPAASPPRQAALRYSLRDEDELRVLTLPRGGTRSIYDQRGLVPGTERPERFFLWPMGIESAGQMRQWGHHATAFAGRRHFDDPELLDRYFEVVERSM